METLDKKQVVTNSTVSRPKINSQYENFIGGEWVKPLSGIYFDNLSPMDGSFISKVARSNEKDVEKAIDAAQFDFKTWSKTSVTERSAVLLKIADKIEENLEYLAQVETVENGKAIREPLNADLPLVVDHFRYFAGVIRGEEGTATELNSGTLSVNIHEPIGVVGQIIPWNFPLLMATWKIAPAIAAGCCTILKPAEQTPTSIMVLMDLIKDIVPKGVINVINGFGIEAGQPLAKSPRIQKVSFTGETSTG